MKKNLRKIFSALIFFIGNSDSFAQKTEWQRDIGFLIQELQGKSNLFSQGKDFEAFKNELHAFAENINDSTPKFSSVLKLKQIFAKQNVIHFNVMLYTNREKEIYLPFRFYQFENKVCIVAATEEFKNYNGYELIAINNFKINTVIDSLNTLVPAETEGCKKGILEVLSYVEALMDFGFADNNEIKLKLTDKNGDNLVLAIVPSKLTKSNEGLIAYTAEKTPFYVKNESEWFYSEYILQDSIYYIQYNKCWSKELEKKFGRKSSAKAAPSFERFTKKVKDDLEKLSYKKVVVDLRLNTGGASPQGKDFIDEVFADEKFKDKIFLVTSNRTASSAILNAVYLKQKTNCITIGEEPCGKPNHFGEIKVFVLPMSKVRLCYPTKYFQNVNPHENYFRPEIPVSTSYIDFITGTDSVYQAILNYNK